MKLSYLFFKNYPVTRILIGKLMNAQFPTIKSSYRVKKMVDEMGKEFEIFKELLMEQEKKIKFSEDGKSIENKEQVEKDFEELYSHNFEMDFAPLSEEELQALKEIAPKELELLEMISEPTAFDSLI